MPTTNRHQCNLPVKDTTGLPKLPPNAHWIRTLIRYLRILLLLNSKHNTCKKLFRNNAAIERERRRHASGPHFFVIHPLSTFNVVMEAMFVIVWFYFILMEPLISFMKTDKAPMAVMRAHRRYLTFLQVIFISIFFITGYIDNVTNCIVLEPKKIIRKYLFSFFVFDFFSTYLAIDIPSNFLIHDPMDVQLAVLYSYLFRMFAVTVRIPTLLRFLNGTLRHLKLGRSWRSIVCYFVKTFLILHLYSFMMVAVSGLELLYFRNNSKGSWIIQNNFNKKQMMLSYLDVFQMVFCYFFGIQYRYMESPVDQVCVVVIAFSGRLYTLYLLADILRILGIAGISQSLYQRRLWLIQNYMAEKNLSGNLRQRMLRYCDFKFQGRYFYEDKIRNSLSDNLRAELFMFTARKLVQKVVVFKNLPPPVVASIMEAMRSEIFSPKDIIIAPRSEIAEIFFISSGTVAITTSNGKELCHLEDGQEFGTDCLFVKHHLYAVVAIDTTEVFIIDKDQMIKLLSAYPGLMEGFYRSAKERLAKYKLLKDQLSKDNIDVLAELERGHILEKPTKRLSAVD